MLICSNTGQRTAHCVMGGQDDSYLDTFNQFVLGFCVWHHLQNLQLLFPFWMGFAMSEFNKPTEPRQIPDLTDPYFLGWNEGLEKAAYKLEHEFSKAFGKDTLQSIAIYIRTLKK